jgi:hypothetical protein
MIRDTDAKNRGHQLRWYKMYKESEELKHRYNDKQREGTTEKPKTKHNNNKNRKITNNRGPEGRGVGATSDGAF